MTIASIQSWLDVHNYDQHYAIAYAVIAVVLLAAMGLGLATYNPGDGR